MKHGFRKALPHLCVVFSLAALTVCVADTINSQMGFLASTWGRVLLIVANALSAIFAAYAALREDGG